MTKEYFNKDKIKALPTPNERQMEDIRKLDEQCTPNGGVVSGFARFINSRSNVCKKPSNNCKK